MLGRHWLRQRVSTRYRGTLGYRGSVPGTGDTWVQRVSTGYRGTHWVRGQCVCGCFSCVVFCIMCTVFLMTHYTGFRCMHGHQHTHRCTHMHTNDSHLLFQMSRGSFPRHTLCGDHAALNRRPSRGVSSQRLRCVLALLGLNYCQQRTALSLEPLSDWRLSLLTSLQALK